LRPQVDFMYNSNMNLSRNKKIAFVYLFLATLIWAATYSVTKVALVEVPPIRLAFLRGVVAIPFLLGMIFYYGKWKEVLDVFKKHWGFSILFGLTGIFLMNVLQNIGLQYSSTIMAGILINVNPIFVLFLAALLLGEKLSGRKMTASVLGFVGILFVVLGGEDLSGLLGSEAFFGNVMFLCVALAWTVYTLSNKALFKKYDALTLTFVANVTGTLLLLPATLFFDSASGMFTAGFAAWSSVVFLGIFASGLAILFWNSGLSRIEASKASVFQYLTPALAIVIGLVFLKESLSFSDVIGGILIFLSVYWINK
jgi:drug/metabolite transporter (DMT)-like permease